MCRTPTCGPDEVDGARAISTGEAAHIKAAREGGPRYDPRMTPSERSNISNGIWLCANCHTKVDSSTATYTVESLLEMKRAAESRASEEFGGRGTLCLL